MKADTRRARLIMELRQGGVTDRDVLAAMERVPRDEFVPDFFKERAWENTALPISAGQTISQPLVVGLMTQALMATKRHKVLEIGTGSGYQTAILAKCCRRVYTIERIRELLQGAEALLDRLQIRNVTTRLDDGSRGWPEQAPFDRIIVTAAAPKVPETLLNQLAVGGVMVVPVGAEGEDQVLVRIHRDEGGFHHEFLTGVRFVPLVSGATA
ncbi:MAG: protein-L-isoaspartate(D-aspartate) O-methyltransferase [Rhodospirillaceae bacterium]|nr:protein-L-isoaspartate(D-aspartate) O-methyltransferase [Rhodospirillaceae bacterium]